MALGHYLGIVIVYNMLVILWGALVRATGSGAGCGSHWPLCNGQVLPEISSIQTQIEFAHRVSSGLSLPLVLIAGVWVFRKFPKGTWIRVPAMVACISILAEALIGAGLVLFELVSHDQSLKRVISICLHFTNTLVLIGSLVLVATSSFRAGKGWKWSTSKYRRPALLFVGLFFLVGIAGAVTALGDTLFPAQSLAHGFQQDLNPASHFLIKLRVIHPILALVFAGLAGPWVYSLLNRNSAANFRKISKGLLILLFLNIGVGLLNLIWLAPLGLQLFHLCLALTIWIVWVVTLDKLLTDAT